MEILRWVKRYAMGVVAALLFFSVMSSISESTAADSGADGSLSTTEVANHFLDAIGQYLGISNNDLVVTRADSEKPKIGRGIMYDFGVETSDRAVEFSLVTDTSWQSYEQGMLGPDKHGGEGGEENSEVVDEGAGDGENRGAGTVGVWQDDKLPFPHRTKEASIPTFQMAGPVELWLQDAENVRLAMPHDVDAGRLKRVVVADGAVVKIQGPREVSLIGTLQLPLPLGSSSAPNPGGLLGLATRLRAAARSQDRPIVSLRVVGPTSLVAVPPQGIQDEAAGRLKVRRLAPGAVELVSREAVAHGDVEEEEEEEWGTELSEVWVWPLPQLRGSDLRLAGVERAFHDVLGSEAYKKGYFRLTKAKASVVTLMQVRFEVGKQNSSDAETTGIADGEIVGESDMGTRTVWEATVKIDGQRVQPLNARPIESHVTGYSMQPLRSNSTLLGSGNLGLLGPMTLDVNWGYYGV